MGGVDVREDILLANLPRTDNGLPCVGSVVIKERLGKGGVGAVYLGYDEKLTAEVAVKVLHFEMAENVGVVERFLREARSTFKLDHPNVVRVLAVDVEAGTHYIVMEYVDGESAEARVRREGPLPERDALEIALWTGDALAAAHAENILHRDVKPANIMIRYRDGRVKLTDLGLAKALGRESEAVSGLTASGQMLGTPSYMSPEQARDASSADQRSDIYSLGATLYTLLTNEAPFEATQLFDLLVKVMRREPKDIRSFRRDVTDGTVALLKKLMDKAPPQRPQTMQEVVGIVRACLQQAATKGARGLARPKMAGKRKAGAGEGVTPGTRSGTRGVAGERSPTPALPPRRARGTKPVGTSPVAERSPTPALPQQTIPDQAGWQQYAADKRSRPTVGVPVAMPTGRGKKVALILGIIALLGAVGGTGAYIGLARGGDKMDPAVEAKVASLVAVARTFRETGMLNRAQVKLVEALVVAPGHRGAKRELAEIRALIASKKTDAERAAAYEKLMDDGLRLKRAGKLQEAAAAYSGAAEYAPSGSREAAQAAAECFAEYYKTQAMKASVRGDLVGAVEFYAKALDKKDDPEIRLALAELKSKLKARHVGEADKAKVERLLRRAQEAEELGELKGAVEYCRQAARYGADVAARIASLEAEIRSLDAAVRADASGAHDGGEGPASREPSLTVNIGGGLRLEMKYIAPGRFIIGSTGGGYDEKPAHEVAITRGFYLGKCEVTQAQYEYVTRENPSHFKRSDGPVESVSWDDVIEFCRRLTERTRKEFRLPTEAEWEYAARAGSTSKYCFGDSEATLGGYAWHAGNSGKQTHPVGRKRRNDWKLYDMHGNVWEWCSDWYSPSYYAKRAGKDPEGPSSGRARVLRGGSWDAGPDYCRSARRNKYIPTGRYYSFGFRVAHTPAD